MDNELRYFLERGPTSVKELARLTGKSTSTIYKALKADGVENQKSDEGTTLFFIVPIPAVEAAESPSEDRSAPSPTPISDDAPAQPPAPGKRGRKPTADGKRLTALVESNNRRANSHGFRSLQVILDNPGITTSEFIAKGGRLNDLRWDLAKSNVKAED